MILTMWSVYTASKENKSNTDQWDKIAGIAGGLAAVGVGFLILYVSFKLLYSHII